MKRYKQETREVVSKTLESIECDRCGAIIGIKEARKGNYKAKYFHVVTYHNDWGNDSIDSTEFYDFCSYECLEKDLKKYYEKARGTEEYDISLWYAEWHLLKGRVCVDTNKYIIHPAYNCSTFLQRPHKTNMSSKEMVKRAESENFAEVLKEKIKSDKE